MNVSYKKSVHLKFSPLCNILPVDICETPHSQLPCVSMDGWHMNFSRTSPSRLTEVLGTCVLWADWRHDNEAERFVIRACKDKVYRALTVMHP